MKLRPRFNRRFSIDRLREDIWKSAHLIFTVTVRPRQFIFSHRAQTSSAIAITPASIRAGSIRSSEKVVSDPEERGSIYRIEKDPNDRVAAAPPTDAAEPNSEPASKKTHREANSKAHRAA
jgi:hypothetical protein